MKTYIVGGAVRDRILGLPVVDRDHVVVGSSVDEMIAAGFRPVGRDFPVFLHPETHEEYALARTERKVARGYAGFVFHTDASVTLEADLARRDLTINAMALDEATGEIVDPFGGRRDLAARVLRHVGPAFVEDPVRILRVARFAARFDDFTFADETLALMRSMVAQGEVDALVPERVWQEVARGLMERTPSRLVRVLRDAGALARLFPELDALFGDDAGAATLAALDRAAAAARPLEVRFAVLIHRLPEDAVERVCERWAVPRATRDVAVLVAREGAELVRLADGVDAEGVVRVFERCDAFRRAPRFELVTAAIAITSATAIESRLARCVTAARSVDAGAIAREAGFDPTRVAAALRSARIDAVNRKIPTG